MAEFLGQEIPTKLNNGQDDGFSAMGRPIPILRKRNAYIHLKNMGVTDSEYRFRCVAMVAARLEHDDPYGALGEATKFVDLTGAYRLMAVLLTGDQPDAE